MANAPDLRFTLKGRDETQQAFDAATRRARAFGDQVESAAGATNALVAAQKASAAATRAQASAMGAVAARSRNLSYQLVDIGQALATAPTMGIYALQNLGFQVAQIGQLYAGQGGFNQAIKDSAKQVGGFVTRFAPLGAAVGIAAAAFAGMTYEINRSGDVTVGFGDVFKATMLVAAESINNLLKPAIQSIAGPISSTWDWIVDKTTWLGNTIINSFRAVGSDIKFIFETIPTIVQASAIGAANGIISGVNAGVQKAGQGIDWLIDKANKIPGVDIGKVGNFQALDLIENTASADLGKLNEEHRKVVESILASDPLGDFYDRVAGKARELALATEEVGKAAEKAKDPWKGLRKAGTDAIDKIRAAASDLGQSVGGIFRGLLDKTLSWKDAAVQAMQSVLRYLDQMNLARGGSGLFGGGIFGGIVKGILGFANGTNFAPGGMAIVGERGPELVNLPRGSQVVPNHRLMAANANGSGAQTININVNVDGARGNAEIEEMVQSGVSQGISAAAPGLVQSASRQAVRDIAPGGKSARGLQKAYNWTPAGRRAS